MKPFTLYSLSIAGFLFSVSAFFLTMGTPEFKSAGILFGWLWAIYHITITPLERIRSSK